MATLNEALQITVKADMTAFSRTMNAVSRAASVAASGVRKSFGMLHSFLTSTVAKITALLGAGGLAGAFILAMKKAAEAERAFANLAGLFRESVPDLHGYKDAIDELSLSMGIGAVEMTDAFYQSVSAGFRTLDDAKSVVQAASLAAIGGSVELPTAVEAVTRILTAYRMEAKESMRVSDMLFQTVNYGMTTFEELAPRIGMVAGIAASAKIPIEEMLAAFAVLTQTMKPERAATSLQAIIGSFVKPAEEAKKAAEGIGYNLSAAGLAANGLLKSMRDLAGMDIEQIAQIFPEREALRGIVELMKEQARAFQDTLIEMENSTGATVNASEKQMDTLSFQWDKTFTHLMLIFQHFGEIFKPEVKALLKWLDENWLKTLDEWVAKVGEWWKKESELIKSDEGGIGMGIYHFVMRQVEAFQKWWKSEETQNTLNTTITDVLNVMMDYVMPLAVEIGSAIGKAMLDALVNTFKKLFKAIREGWDPLGWAADILFPSSGYATGGLIPRFATGGNVRGLPGTDTIPARLTAGEFVMNAPAARANRPILEAMNEGSSYHDASVNQFYFGDKYSRRMVNDQIIPALKQAKRRGWGAQQW